MTTHDASFSRVARAFAGSAIRRAGELAARSRDLVSFAPGFPDPGVFPWDDCREIAADLLNGRDPWVLQYGQTRGAAPLLESLIEILASRGIAAVHDEILVTTGSQQGLDLCARVFADPGDVVLVERPTYTGALTAFGNVGARVVGVDLDSEGIGIEALEEAWSRETRAGHRVACVYVIPNFQNPTGALTSLARRADLLAWASRRRAILVEDDPYGALYFDDMTTPEATRPLKADDADGRVVYLSSFSKTVAPGLRVAWVAAPVPIAERFELAKQSADLCSGSLDQRLVDELWRRGRLAARLPELRARYQTKRAAMEAALRRELGAAVSWVEPRGGFFLWATFDGLDTDALLSRAIDHGVVYVPASAFYLDSADRRHARLAFSGSSVAQIELGVARLGRAVSEERLALGYPAAG